jgi:hypothetical protein
MDRLIEKAIIQAYQADNTLLTAFQTERNSLVLELASNPESAKEITSGSGNGTSFTANVSMTKGQRLSFLQIAIDAIQRGYPTPNKSIGVFW